MALRDVIRWQALSMLACWFGVAVGIAFASIRPAIAAADSSSNEARIAEKLASLDLPAYAPALPSQKAAQARDAIKNANYPAARKIVADVLAGSRLQSWRFYPFDEFIGGIVDVNDPESENHLNDWAKEQPDDPVSLLVRAQYFYDVGWFKRGSDFSPKILREHLVAFQDYMSKALADIDASIHLDDSNPYSFYLKLRILQGFGLLPGMKTAFTAAIGKYPGYYRLYSVMLTTHEPKWGGSVPAMYTFVEEHAGKATENSPIKFLYLNLYRELLQIASRACNQGKPNNDQLTQCVQAAMGKLVQPTLEPGVQTALRLYDHSDTHQFRLATRELLFLLLSVAGGDTYSGAVLQLAATAMQSDTQLQKSDSSHSDYVIDEAVARSWQQKGFYDNALAKYQQALLDVRRASFPDEAEKNLATAHIYEQLAYVHQRERRYVDAIAYAKAAIALADIRWGQHYVCYSYYALKEFEAALPACTDTITRSGNLRALFWRGKSFDALGRSQEAERDLRGVAESESDYRAWAAIELTMIYFKRKDNTSALEVLNKYSYLYNEGIAKKSEIAVAYNNRCYAYMELGDLKKALSDCTASLRYGSLPDAYRKQQELVKRLKDQDKNTDLGRR